ncbi:hypothetical protein A7E78_12645 [Syntrophotalea acetylenivorans]|uniref:OmpW family protein n=1 Tax=Syntrophotalea acetylenivorans TaxID=1842532 RepID=A0A1L3GRR9_9BACT|nr:OmpW family outer membrane protein [Syntrophotalea acetylenivorans]APG28617.1 hypothetical protein A7E78_12645 [Syntrophotalea acetylenivorans]
MNRSKFAVLVGALCAVVFAFSMVSTAMAAEDFKRWSLSTQIMYLDVDLGADDLDAYGKISAEDTMTGGLVVEYFFTPNVSAELVAAIAHVDIDLGSAVANGDTWVLPPSLYAKYHFMPESRISPYVGAGINWMFFWGEGMTVNALGNADAELQIDNSFGWNAKIGADIKITENVYANVDIMYLNNETELDTAIARNVDLDVEVWSYNVGLKYRF